MRPADMITSEVSGTQFGECNVITVLRDVTYLTFVGTADQRSGFTYIKAAFYFRFAGNSCFINSHTKPRKRIKSYKNLCSLIK